jgi:hypothetical protein
MYNTYIPLMLDPRKGNRDSYEMPTFYENDIAVKNTADMTVGKPIAV